jgi:hypothetical protein
MTTSSTAIYSGVGARYGGQRSEVSDVGEGEATQSPADGAAVDEPQGDTAAVLHDVLPVSLWLLGLSILHVWFDYALAVYYGAAVTGLVFAILRSRALTSRLIVAFALIAGSANVITKLIYDSHFTSPSSITLAHPLQGMGWVGLALLVAGALSETKRSELARLLQPTPRGGISYPFILLLLVLGIGGAWATAVVVRAPVVFATFESDHWERSELETKLGNSLAERAETPVSSVSCFGDFPAPAGETRVCQVQFTLLREARLYEVALSPPNFACNRIR